MFWLMLVNFMFNMLMLTPLIYTGSNFTRQTLKNMYYFWTSGTNIIARHQLLSQTIGTRREEEDSYRTVINLMIASTAAVLLFSLCEGLLYFRYNQKVRSVSCPPVLSHLN